jgi:hypothetical protein
LPPEGVLALDHKNLRYVGWVRRWMDYYALTNVLIACRRTHSMPSDCWSAGVILYTVPTATFSQPLWSSCEKELDLETKILATKPMRRMRLT